MMLTQTKKCISIYFKHIRIVSTCVPKVKNKIDKSQNFPLITCKRPNFNLYLNEINPISAKFGDIPLASSGWKHHKSKGDHFIIHPTADENEQENQLENIELLKNFNIDNQFINNIQKELEISKITKIQQECTLKIVDMNHVLIAAETGCGKTLAYLIPIVQQILDRKQKSPERDFNTPLALIITPGRELASQIGDVAEKLCSNTGIKIKVVQGGSMKKKILNPEFDSVDILIGSMGAISKLNTTKIYRMNEVRHVVLDEADTLLDDSFSDKLCHMLKKFPFHKNHLQDIHHNIVGSQLILASATMPTNINELLSKIIDTDTIHEVTSPKLHRLLPNITQKFIRMNKSERPAKLLALVKDDQRKNRPTIIFSNKSATSDFINIFLNNSGINCVNLNGDMLMKIRIGQFEKFQSGEVDVLSTTDLGSRGLDTTRARHIINFDFPLYVSDYIHRCGRIGRIGSYEKCIVTNLISSLREIDVVQKIEHSARTGELLPNVNANIRNLIVGKIMKSIEKENKAIDKLF